MIILNLLILIYLKLKKRLISLSNNLKLNINRVIKRFITYILITLINIKKESLVIFLLKKILFISLLYLEISNKTES